MTYFFTPQLYQTIANVFYEYRFRLLIWSISSFILFTLLTTQMNVNTPTFLIIFNMFIMFLGLQTLVFSSFLFFFQELPSSYEKNKSWLMLYQLIEWGETLLFTVLLPLPFIFFIFAMIKIT
jgi:hypothetical protein